MNPFHPSHRAQLGDGPPAHTPLYLDPKIPGQSQNHSEPAFMQPLLPPHQLQTDPTYAPGPSTSCSPVHAPPDYYAHSAQTFQGHVPAAQLQNFQSQGGASYVPDPLDEGYPLVFRSLDDFLRWRTEEEDREAVEFVKVGSSRSKTAPPSVDEVARLVCSRNFKNARNKYVNTLPERTRNTPSSQRNMEAKVCPASICYRTYFGTTRVRANYFKQHSHPIGRENLPFTRRGRNIAEHERRTQQQNEFFRTNAVMDPGTMSPAASIPTAANNREVGNGDAVRIEPPPMASLKPPDSSTNDSPVGAVPVVPAAVEYPPQKLPQDHIGFIQVSPPQDCRLPYPSTTVTLQQQDGAPVPALAPQPHAPYDRNCAAAIPRFPEAAFAVPPIARSNGRNQAFRPAPPPPPPPPPPPSYNSNLNATMRQPQPTYLQQTAEAFNHQAQQYLPTPTTPSTQIQNLHPYPYPYPHSEPLCQREPEMQSQAAPLSNGTQVSPLSPVTPQTQNLPGPPGPSPSMIDARSTSAPHYLPTGMHTFDEARWNRLDALFQAVRLRARSYPFPEPGVIALDSLLSRLYAECQQMHSRPEGDQPPTYQQQQHLQQTHQLQ